MDASLEILSIGSHSKYKFIYNPSKANNRDIDLTIPSSGHIAPKHAPSLITPTYPSLGSLTS